tara:strand:- start:821 stop:1360 length:540 start_codon:yes stop_codon:yes gene_type:complete
LAEPIPQGGIYATAGLGVADIDRGTGVGVPLRFTMVAPTLKTMVSLSPLDLTFVQGSQDSRYARLQGQFGPVCYDTQTRRYVSNLECSSTDVVRSLSAEAAVVPFDQVYFAGKEGMLFGGLGYRFKKPETAYGMIGLFFPTPSGRSGELRLSLGGDFIFIGVSWGYNLTRLRPGGRPHR